MNSTLAHLARALLLASTLGACTDKKDSPGGPKSAETAASSAKQDKTATATNQDEAVIKKIAAPADPTTAGQRAAKARPDLSGIEWIHNDYSTALSRAKTLKKPLLIDMWADWCHTCLSMKKGVLRDRGLASIADKFVWLSVDTESPASAAAMKAFPPKVWPTFTVASPGDESIQATQLGSSSVTEFRDFAERGLSAHLATLDAGGALKPGSALALLRAGDRFSAAGDTAGNNARAAKSYGRAIKAGGVRWGLLASTRKAQIAALYQQESKKTCAKLALATVSTMAKQHNSSGTDFMFYASDCASALKTEEAKALRIQSLKALLGILADPEAALSADDRSDALATARAIAEALGNLDLASSYAVRQRAVLRSAVAAAGTPLEEMTYVWHLVEVNVYLGQGHSILPWVESLEARLPKEYDPPYRRAWLLAKLGRNQEAHDAAARALPLAEGARRGRILGLDADIYKAEGRPAQERQVRQAVVTYYKGLADGLVSPKKLARAEKALAALTTHKSSAAKQAH